MNHDSFTAKYNGKFVDYDGYYGNQCVDLMRQYIKECLGINPSTIPAVGYAAQIYQNFNSNNKWFTRIANTPTNIPKKGDIVIWKYYPFVTGMAGHVAIFDNGNMFSLITFDQNWGNPKCCRFVKHSYKGVLGWLRKK